MTVQKQVVVFGGSGFLGTYVVQALASAGYRVKIVCRNPQACAQVLTSGPLGQVSVVGGNVLSADSVAKEMAGAWAVVNLVGVLFSRGRQNFQALHVDASENLAKQAARAGVKKFLHISALAVERAAVSRPASIYAQTKLEGEQRVRAAFPTATVLRPSVMFGPEDDFFNRFATLAKWTRTLPAIGGGRSRFQPVYVGDVATAVVRALELPHAMGETYELGGPHQYSMRDIYRYVKQHSGVRAAVVPLPWKLASLMGIACGILPIKPPLTLDQVRLLATDNIRTNGALGLLDLGVSLTPMDAVVPAYLALYA